MTITEYSYTETDIYRAIVQTAVPIALTADEVDLLVADLIALGADMPHDGPSGVFAELRRRITPPDRSAGRVYFDLVPASSWRGYVDTLSAGARRTASLERITRQYPRLTETER